MLTGRALLLTLLIHIPVGSAPAQLRPRGIYLDGVAIPGYDAESHVYREHIEVLLPPTYLLAKRPDPAVVGFFAWKFSFGTNSPVTFVFRADTALRVNDERAILRASRLFLCEAPEQWILTCNIPIAAKATMAHGGVVIDIRAPEIVSAIRASAPTVLVRQLFEPGGRFRVDETGIKYSP